MLKAECPRCRRVHWSDEAHDGRYLKCAGCGDAVRIGEQKSGQIEPLRPTQNIPRRQTKLRRGNFFSGIRYPKLLLMVLAVFCLSAVYLSVSWRDRNHNSRLSAHPKPPLELQSSRSVDEAANSNTPSQPLDSEPSSDSTRAIPSYDSQSNKTDVFSYTYFANGQEVMRGSKKRGLGRLTLANGTQKDAVALLFRENTDVVARSVYVLAGQSANIDKLATGKYFVRVTLGQKWSNDDRSFIEGDEYFTFPHSYEFREENVGEKIESDQVSLTLHSVPGGNIQKEPITKAQFLAIKPAID